MLIMKNLCMFKKSRSPSKFFTAIPHTQNECPDLIAEQHKKFPKKGKKRVKKFVENPVKNREFC